MRSAARNCGLFGLLVFVVLFSGTLATTSTALFGQEDCVAQVEAAKDSALLASLKSINVGQVVRVAGIPSVPETEALGVESAIELLLPIPSQSNPTRVTLQRKSLRSRFFRAQLYSLDERSSFSQDPLELPERAYTGYVTGNPDNSLVSLYQIGDTLSSSAVSGFVITDLANASETWYIIEPAAPLEAIVQTKKPESFAQVESAAAACPEALIAPEGVEIAQRHLVYNAKDTDFELHLGGLGRHEQDRIIDMNVVSDAPRTLQTNDATTASNVFETANSTATPKRTVEFTAVGDKAFYDLYQGVSNKTWWEALEEVVNTVDDFYREQLKSQVDFQLNVLALEAWTQGGPGTGLASVDALNLLCQFAQNVPTFAGPHTEPLGSGKPFIAHLFTGHELGPIDRHGAKSVQDFGIWCGANCAVGGSNVLGLAEGLGGLWNASQSECATEDPITFDFSGQHSLSQHNLKAGIVTDGDDLNTNFDGILLQRVLLVAHEIGHNLNGEHTADPASVLHTSISDVTGFVLDSNNVQNVTNCLNGSC